MPDRDADPWHVAFDGPITTDDLVDGFRRAFQPTPPVPEPGNGSIEDLVRGVARQVLEQHPTPPPTPDLGHGSLEDLVRDVARQVLEEHAPAADGEPGPVRMPSGRALGGEPQVPAVELPAPVYEPSDADLGYAEPPVELFDAPAAPEASETEWPADDDTVDESLIEIYQEPAELEY